MKLKIIPELPATQEIQQLLLSCTADLASDRPSFEDICEKISSFSNFEHLLWMNGPPQLSISVSSHVTTASDPAQNEQNSEYAKDSTKGPETNNNNNNNNDNNEYQFSPSKQELQIEIDRSGKEEVEIQTA